MKHSKMILGAVAAIVAISASFAANAAKRFAAGTLYTLNSGTSKVHCQRIDAGKGSCASITYYTQANGAGTKITSTVFSTGL